MARITKQRSMTGKVKGHHRGGQSSGNRSARLGLFGGFALGVAAACATVIGLTAQDSARMLPRYEHEPARAEAEIIINQFTAAEFCGLDTGDVRRQFTQARRKFVDDGILSPKEFREFRHRAITLAEQKFTIEGPEGFLRWCSSQADSNVNFFIMLANKQNGAIDAAFSGN